MKGDFEDNQKNTEKGFIPCYAGKSDVETLNRFLDTQGPGDTGDEIDMMFSDKVKLAKTSVLQIMSQINERLIIKKMNVERIYYDIDKCRTGILNAEDVYSRNYSANDKDARSRLEAEITRLEQEKRKEETSCWRDLVQLRKELMMIMSEYKNNSRKKKMLSMEVTEHFENG